MTPLKQIEAQMKVIRKGTRKPSISSRIDSMIEEVKGKKDFGAVLFTLRDARDYAVRAEQATALKVVTEAIKESHDDEDYSNAGEYGL